jgi:endonuclease G
MKKILLLIILGLALGNINAQTTKNDIAILKHLTYTSHYSKSLKYPVMVEWWATRAKVTCKQPIPRKDDFAPDPLLPEYTNLAKDYVGSGTDRGHMAPAADNQCSGPKAMIESFYFSNMAAQYGALNRGDWKTLEMLTRKMAADVDSIHVWAGNIGEAKRIGNGGVAVPKQCWKVIYVVKTKQWHAYLFNNDLSKADGIQNNLVTKAYIEKLTGFKFN